MSSERWQRWRLVMGKSADEFGGGLGPSQLQMDQALDFLYRRGEGSGGRDPNGERSAGLEDSALTVPDWINAIHQLFPQETIERLEKDAIERYEITEIVTNEEVLERVEANETLLKAVLQTKHLMNQNVLAAARTLVAKVVQKLMEKLAQDIESPFRGVADPRKRSNLKIAANFDAKETLRRNLHRYDLPSKRLIIERPYFYSRVRRSVDRWDIIIVVDQSGSMVSSAIHAAVTAAIFWDLRDINTHLVLFDTNVVDVTESCSDPVETLMRVQLGGGTDIGQAMSYAHQLVSRPDRTIVVLVTDFYEGGSVDRLLRVTKAMVESGVTLLGLAALDSNARPDFDRNTAGKMVQLGAHVAAMTPGELANWVAEKVK